MQNFSVRGDCSHAAFTRVQQRARVRVVHLAAPEQPDQPFNNSGAVRDVGRLVGHRVVGVEMGDLLLLPRSRRVLARAAIRARLAAACM